MAAQFTMQFCVLLLGGIFKPMLSKMVALD